MMKKVGVLALILAGSLAVFQPAVAQAMDRNDARYYDRHEDRRRDFDRDRGWRERERREEIRERERWDNRRVYNNGYRYYAPPNYYAYPYCPR